MLLNSAHQQTMQCVLCIEQIVGAALTHQMSFIIKYAVINPENSPAEHRLDALGLDVSGCQTGGSMVLHVLLQHSIRM